MAYLQESYMITSDDQSQSITVKKDAFGYLYLTLTRGSQVVDLVVPEEMVSQFIGALKRLA